MGKYKCKVCGYVYRPKFGDQRAKVAPDTPFHKLPDEWICPICGASKKYFIGESL